MRASWFELRFVHLDGDELEHARAEGVQATMDVFFRLPGALLVPAALLVLAETAIAETATESWVDPNYASCEGIGASATGRVNVHADFSRSGDVLTISSLSLTTEGHQHEHAATGRITYTAPNGSRSEVRLERPWFPTISSDRPSENLYLPRVRTDAAGPNPREQMEISVKAGSPIDLAISLLFSVPGGYCPTSFGASWTLG